MMSTDMCLITSKIQPTTKSTLSPYTTLFRSETQPEVGEGGDDDECRRQYRVEKAAAPPRAQHADQGAERERDYRRHSDEPQRPRQALLDDVAHRRRKEGQRCAEIAAERVAQVLEVLLKDALVVVDSERNLERLDRLWAHPSMEADGHCLPGIAGHDPRQDEVDGQGGPDGDDEEFEAPGDVAHLRIQ